jgi:hypothetical protein
MNKFDTNFFEINNKFLNIIEEYQGEFNPLQMAAMLIIMGADLSFCFAPNMEEARNLIQESVRIAQKKFLKGEE